MIFVADIKKGVTFISTNRDRNSNKKAMKKQTRKQRIMEEVKKLAEQYKSIHGKVAPEETVEFWKMLVDNNMSRRG